MSGELRWRDLPARDCHIAADPRLVRQLLAGVITQARGESAGHSFERVEQISAEEAIVRFKGRVLGLRYETVERVASDAEGLSFELLKGYLPAVEEKMTVVDAPGGCRVLYSGHFRPRPGMFGRSLGPLLVPWIYGQEVKASLAATKRMAEARQAKSGLFARPGR